MSQNIRSASDIPKDEITHVAGGHKATLKNPNVSEEAKEVSFGTPLHHILASC